MPAVNQFQDIWVSGMLTRKAWIICNCQVEFVYDLTTSFIGAFHVVQYGPVFQGPIASIHFTLRRPVAGPVDHIRPPDHQGKPPVFVDIPQFIESIQL
jgi:hypothetical protein